VRLASGTHWHDVVLRVTMAPVRNGDEAAARAPQLGAI
jgi:hypothetical protein